MSGDTRENFSCNLSRSPVVAILRGVSPETVLEVGAILIDEGIRLLEVTMDSPGAAKSIGMLAKRHGGSDGLCIGAGTVLTPDNVKEAVSAGARFIISPNTCVGVIETAKTLGVISIPGFYTASEAFTAMDAGADYLKLFPARSLGPGYVKDIKAVVARPVIATGGIDMDNIAGFLEVCAGVGIGSSLYSPGKSLEGLRRDAAALIRTAQGRKG